MLQMRRQPVDVGDDPSLCSSPKPLDDEHGHHGAWIMVTDLSLLSQDQRCNHINCLFRDLAQLTGSRPRLPTAATGFLGAGDPPTIPGANHLSAEPMCRDPGERYHMTTRPTLSYGNTAPCPKEDDEGGSDSIENVPEWSSSAAVFQ